MDHLLRNRRLGSLATPVSNLFLCPLRFTFYTSVEAEALTSLELGRQFLLNRCSEREQGQGRGVSVHGDGCTSIEVDFVPSVRNHVAAVHIGRDGRVKVGPCAPSPWMGGTLIGG